MSVTNLTTTKTTHAESTPEWLGVSAAVGRMVRTWADRTDIAAYAAPGAGEGKPAFFNPNTCEVEINVETCFGAMTEPREVTEIDTRAVQFEWPRAAGAIFHEAMHARFSKWNLREASAELTNAEFTALVLLEEGRIEFQGLERFPSNAAFLRTMALDIVIDDIAEVATTSDTLFAGSVAALALARVDAGSLRADDIEELREVVADKLGEPVIAKLQELWRTAQSYRNHEDIRGLYPVAREWVEVLDKAAEANGDSTSTEPGEAGTGAPGTCTPGTGTPGADGGKPVRSTFMKELDDMLEEAADMAGISAYDDLADMETTELWEAEAKDKASAAKDRKGQESTASQVFGKGTAEVHGTSSRSYLVSKRLPSSTERAAAVQIARLLEKAKYRDRDEHTITSVVPPGRLRTRAAVQGAALKSKGIMSQSEPWRRTVRKHTDDPTLSIGVMVDISGSMGAAMEPMAVTAWVLSEAARRVQGRAAMVYFGNDVFPTLKPGQHLDEVKLYTAPDMTEKFDKAFKAINGSLGLTWGTGARMLVVVSDGQYTAPETSAAIEAIKACDAAGVAVLWLDMGGREVEAKMILRGSKAAYVSVGSSPAGAAQRIGQAAARALEAAH